MLGMVMAEEEKVEGEAEEQEATEESSEGGGGGKLVLLIGLINTIGLCALGYFTIMQPPAAAPVGGSMGNVNPAVMSPESSSGEDMAKRTGVPGPKVDLGEMTVNLKDPMADRYLKVRLELELDKEETRTEVEARLNEIKYHLQAMLSGQRVKDVNGPKNKEALRNNMIRRANAALGGKGRITEVWPSEWVVQ
jgi:flagellar basal body-associated protein FliL